MTTQPEQRYCEGCGDPLPLNAKQDKRYCSKVCYMRYFQRERRVSRPAPPANGFCHFCKAKLPPDKNRGQARKYCDKRCQSAYRYNRTTKQARPYSKGHGNALWKALGRVDTWREWRKMAQKERDNLIRRCSEAA